MIPDPTLTLTPSSPTCPTNTTCTLPNAAVAPDISIILALVEIARHLEKESRVPLLQPIEATDYGRNTT